MRLNRASIPGVAIRQFLQGVFEVARHMFERLIDKRVSVGITELLLHP